MFRLLAMASEQLRAHSFFNEERSPFESTLTGETQPLRPLDMIVTRIPWFVESLRQGPRRRLRIPRGARKGNQHTSPARPPAG